jgi:hypothetical protein
MDDSGRVTGTSEVGSVTFPPFFLKFRFKINSNLINSRNAKSLVDPYALDDVISVSRYPTRNVSFLKWTET